MGFLTEGTTLPWEEAQKYADYIREHGIAQFLATYRKNAARTNEVLYWGDEVRVSRRFSNAVEGPREPELCGGPWLLVLSWFMLFNPTQASARPVDCTNIIMYD